jgi:hypothetical protein
MSSEISTKAFNGLAPERRQSVMRAHAKAEALCETRARHPLVHPRRIDVRRAEKVNWRDPAMRAKLADAYSELEEMTKRLRASWLAVLGRPDLRENGIWVLQPLVARTPHSGPRAAIYFCGSLYGPVSNGQRHGLRGGFQRPSKGDRQLQRGHAPLLQEAGAREGVPAKLLTSFGWLLRGALGNTTND